MRFTALSISILFSICSNGQLKSFQLTSTGDTINRVDVKTGKQGKWLVQMPALRGEKAYEEEGVYVNNKKEGVWRKYNLQGDPIAIETFRWGYKHGLSMYLTFEGLEHEENWRATNPDKGFDTIDVQDPVDPNKYERVIIKNEGNSLRHGKWRYFDPKSGRLLATENYFLDNLVLNDPLEFNLAGVKSISDSSKTKAAEKPKPKEVVEFEKKTSGKKKAVRDGRTGG